MDGHDLDADNLFSNIMVNNMILADLVDCIRNMYCLFKYKLCKIFYKDVCVFVELTDDNSYVYNGNKSNVSHDLNARTTYWDSFLNFINSVKFFFIKRVIRSYHFSTNMLFNELDICLKNIFNLFNGVGEVAANKANIISELNCVLTKLIAMQNNYVYIYAHGRTYADNKYDYDFYFELVSNMDYQKFRLDNLHSNIKRLESTINLGLGLDLEVNRKIKQAQELCRVFNSAMLEFEGKKFYSYYMIELEVNWVRHSINIMDKEAIFTSEGVDIALANELFDLYIYNLFLENERLSIICSYGFEAGLELWQEVILKDVIRIKTRCLNNQLLFYNGLLGRTPYKDVYNIGVLDQRSFVIKYIYDNVHFKERFKRTSYYLDRLNNDALLNQQILIDYNFKEQKNYLQEQEKHYLSAKLHMG
jgi:hypothetical protein